MAEEGGSPGLSHQACACCRLQRQRCDPATCEMSPYFPIAKLEDFKNAHRLFGVSNIHKIITSGEEGPQRQAAADSVLFEANVRRADPVRGCYGILLAQRDELRARIGQLEAVRRCLEECRRMDPSLGPEERVQALLAARAAGGSGGGGMAAPAMKYEPGFDMASQKEDAELRAYYADLEMLNKMLESIEQGMPGNKLDKEKQEEEEEEDKKTTAK